jgi:hypothetical protein
MKILSHRERREEITYNRFFEYADTPGSGFSFECDENGIVNMTGWSDTKFRNYNGCVLGKINGLTVLNRGVRALSNTWVEPAIGECSDCGDEVVLSEFTNTCGCGTDYNMSGQMLAPREQWGEETGESVADIDETDTDRLFEG